MFTKWTKKESLKAAICFVVFFAGVLATQLPGYLSPLYWAIYPVFAAFVAAGPLTCMMDMEPGFGSAAIFPVLWFIVYRRQKQHRRRQRCHPERSGRKSRNDR